MHPARILMCGFLAVLWRLALCVYMVVMVPATWPFTIPLAFFAVVSTLVLIFHHVENLCGDDFERCRQISARVYFYTTLIVMNTLWVVCYILKFDEMKQRFGEIPDMGEDAVYTFIVPLAIISISDFFVIEIGYMKYMCCKIKKRDSGEIEPLTEPLIDPEAQFMNQPATA
mmetsp:Transcript_34394/g.45274  ORF Transcript_34394/g.45274 Transcript_34394/m.45274 type:complete len:171 (+) Transcript_34394:32-544(+)